MDEQMEMEEKKEKVPSNEELILVAPDTRARAPIMSLILIG